MKKRIGISFTHTLFENYWNWFTTGDLGDDLDLVELSFEKGNESDICTCDGFILTGGIDVDPSFYNGNTIYSNQPDEFQPGRDRFETVIYSYSQANRLPLLAICRGMQLVNVLEGGKLIQDLDDANSKHRKEESDKEHEVHIVGNSLLRRVAGYETGRVNSAHHQAIDPRALGHNLKVNAFDGDEKDIIEGLEFDDPAGKGFMLCVQWHPERMKEKESNPFSSNLKKTFLSEVRKTAMKKIHVTNPANEKIIARLNEDSLDTLQAKLGSLRKGQAAWSEYPLPERVKILDRFSSLLEGQIEALAKILSSEVGKPIRQSRNEINGARARLKWLTENAARYLSDETVNESAAMTGRIVYEPLGVVCNISAWNYPYLVGVNVFVPALLAGNGVMYKPSEYAMLTGLEIGRLLKRAGVPENVFQVALGAKEVGEMLLDLPFDGYFFTGSYRTGRHIYERVAPKMVPCQCELGGKDPLYVANDISDIRSVAAATADGAFYNNGQSCCAVERIYVHADLYDRYVEEFVSELRSWKTGDPLSDEVYLGPLTRKDQLAVIEKQVDDAKKKGASVLCGGKRMDQPGYYFEPTVLVNVDHSMDLMKEESFGPVIGIMKVRDDDEAVRLMQDTAYGLTAAVYSSSQERAEKILKQLNAGTGYWNCCDRVSAALPWSGRKNSGFGSTLSHIGLRAFTKPKALHLRAAQ